MSGKLKREYGYYWIVYSGFTVVALWGYYDWSLPGYDKRFNDSDMSKIYETKLEEPV